MLDRVESRPVQIETADGWRLAGDLIVGPAPQMRVIVSAGTGFPRAFYEGFARFLAERGAEVLIYDNRGIGGSAPEGGLKGSTIEYWDWAQDLEAAVTFMMARAGDLPLRHVAHSVGGHFLGLMQNHEAIERHAFLSVGTGFFGVHHRSYVLPAMYFWWGLGVHHLMRFGYIKSVGLWRGEALPPRLFRSWRRWAMRRSYFRPELVDGPRPNDYAGVRAPISAWVFSDDPIATVRSTPDLLGVYPNAPRWMVRRAPEDFELRRIGHEGAFRAGREALWHEVLDWIVSGQPVEGAVAL